MKKSIIIVSLLMLFSLAHGQSEPSNFRSIAETENNFNSGNIAARMVEGLGFRYYWASEGLRSEDLIFSPVKGGRNSRETINHIYGLSGFLLSALEKKIFVDVNMDNNTFDEVRTATLKNLERAVGILKKSKDSDFKDYNIRFANGSEMPFWNAINGPIADAIYHTGQVVLMRRMSGNPIAEGVSVLTGVKN